MTRTNEGTARAVRGELAKAVLAMAAVVTASNILVQYQVQAFGLQDYLTWGAFTYPFAFLVTDLTNRRFGPAAARRVVLVGFACAVVLSALLATPRIAIASGTAFLAAQLLDIAIFRALRHGRWWLPPLASSLVSSALDTALFFGLAFACGPLPGIGLTVDGLLAPLGIAATCEEMPWVTLALADFGVKVALAVAALGPYGVVLARWRKTGAVA